MLYRIWCSSKWYHSRSIWMGIFQPRFPNLELNSVLITHFFLIDCQNDFWLTIFFKIDDFWLTNFLIDDFDWRFLIDDFWLTILIDDFWLTIFDWRFWLTIFDWRFLIDDFDWRFLIDDFDWRFWLTIFDWRFWLNLPIDDFDWRFSNLESWTQYFYSLFSNDRSWRSELSNWRFWKLCMLYEFDDWMIPLSINLNDWISQPRKLNSVLLLTFFKRSQLKIRTVKMVENYVCCTEFDALSKWYHFRSIWMGIFQPRIRFWLTIFDWRFWLTIFDWRFLIDDFWLTIFDWRFFLNFWRFWRFLIDDFWLTILIDDFWLTIFDWRFWLTIFDWRFWLIDDFWLTILIDDFWLTILIDDFWLTILIDDFWLTIFDWRFWLTIFGLTIFDWIFQPRKLNSVLLLTFFKRSQLKIRTVKMVENYVCCTEFDAFQNDTTLDQFEWEFST